MDELRSVQWGVATHSTDICTDIIRWMATDEDCEQGWLGRGGGGRCLVSGGSSGLSRSIGSCPHGPQLGLATRAWT